MADDMITTLAREGLLARQKKQIAREARIRWAQQELERLSADNSKAIDMLGNPLEEEQRRKEMSRKGCDPRSCGQLRSVY